MDEKETELALRFDETNCVWNKISDDAEDETKKLPPEMIQGYQLEDKVFAQENLPSGSKAVIHYRIEREQDSGAPWRHEPFRESIRGLFVREFLLFYGETLTYYSTVSSGDETFDTPQKQLRVEESGTKGRTRYQLLNRMLMQRNLGAFEKAEHTMKQYLWQEAYVEKMFKQMD